ncbi:unnamed protein product [Mytilus coruscus]|uniref:Zinc finger PHD-type domain-containing protein n=1 Tax=Mytilus coruscus TaxID=42192 RepID=A0A6J8E015_MYTCO|nr:unnamed protein product [Mytilus coruscus]
MPRCKTANDVLDAETIRAIPISAFLLSDEDEGLIKEELSTVIKRILTSHVPCFSDLKDKVVWSIPHIYQAESSKKSDIVPLGVEEKDETKTADVIELLDIYKNYVPQKRDGSPLPMLLYCDGLSCERVDGAQKARINGGDQWARLEMFEPGIQEWHKRLLYIQDTYDTFFKFESHREKGTLYNIKQIYDYKGVSSNIMSCFNKADELLEFTTKVYVILAMMNILGFKTIDDELDEEDHSLILSKVSNEIVNQIYPTTNTKEILNVISDKSLDQSLYCICKLESGGEMVYCGNKKCKFGQWFHLDCIGLSEDEIPEGDWFCSEVCTKEFSSTKRGKKSKLWINFVT